VVRDKGLEQVQSILDTPEDRTSKARRIAEVIRLAGDYRWVGIYEVDENEIANIAWSGAGEPAYPRFPVTQGLSGHAVASGSTVISNDVANDPRYLTAFGSTQSEIIVPIIDTASGTVIGTIDVESERKDAFAEEDRLRLEQFAGLVARLWRK
jgi:L-methionine (R)-S-oxide reductase